mgnify:CR=1 FL=1|jgi:hypothetical protein
MEEALRAERAAASVAKARVEAEEESGHPHACVGRRQLEMRWSQAPQKRMDCH